MIKNSTGERAEKKSMVCVECITLMTPADHREHNGICQLCRGGGGGKRLFVVAFTYDYDNTEPHIAVYVADDYDQAKSKFIEEHDDIEDYNCEEVQTVRGYDILLRPRN